MSIRELYEKNEEFKAFVDKECAMYGYTVEEALGISTIIDVGAYFAKKQKDGATVIKQDFGCGGC